MPAAIAAAALPTAAEPPPPPPPHCMFENVSALQSSAAAMRDGSLRSFEYDAKPSTSRGSTPASSHAARIARSPSTNSGSLASPRL